MTILTQARAAIRRLVGPAQFAKVSLVVSLLRRPSGVMLAVGAHFGYSLAPFAARGWSVPAFEPDTGTREQFVVARRTAPSVHVEHRAVSDVSCQLTTLDQSDVWNVSSLIWFHDSHQPAVVTETVSLRDYLRDRAVATVDLLKIDAEGFDLVALRGFSWETLRPSVVVCEFEDRKTTTLGCTLSDFGDLLSAQGYRVFLSEWYPVVEYGRRHPRPRLASRPAEFLDHDAWGNFIAVVPDEAGRLCFLAGIAALRFRLRHLLERLAPTAGISSRAARAGA